MRFFEKKAKPSLEGLKKGLAINKTLRDNALLTKDPILQKLFNKGVKIDLTKERLYGVGT